MKFNRALLFLLGAVVVVGCGHTNNLTRYNVRNTTAYYRTFVDASAESHAHIEGIGENVIADIAAAVGSVVVGSEGQAKLERAVNGDSIALAVSRGIRDAAGDYLMIRPVASMADGPDLIIETEVTEYKLISSATGVRVHVEGTSRVIDRKTGGIVWEDSESHTVPISSTWIAAAGPSPVSAGVSIANAIQLMNLPEEKIREVIGVAASNAGREIGETLREDVAKLNRK